ncbi:hypothetical protein PTKIN_Ptkin02bG0059500 [Pterospermum kingtungense]
MKLLGWMHRKFHQNSSKQLKDFAIGSGRSCNCIGGQSSPDDQQFFLKPNNSTKPFRQPQRDHLQKSFAGVEAAWVEEEEDYEESSSSGISELFHGFLAIGTLGLDSDFPDPSTPTFAVSVENTTEKETEVTENELKLINDELEKVLGAEAKEEGCNDSSGRNSHVSAGRSSHGSTITLSGKPMEIPDTNSSGTTLCPLQGYLFGSAVTTVAKKEHRTTLGELFQRTKLTEENFECRNDNEKRQTEKQGDKSSVQIIKKMLSSSRSSTAAETKLHKILHMFHRKVHPESSTATYKHDKHQKNEKKGKFYDGGHMLADEDMIYPQRALPKNMRRYKRQTNPPHGLPRMGKGKRECCIKTDGDYLVLEL